MIASCRQVVTRPRWWRLPPGVCASTTGCLPRNIPSVSSVSPGSSATAIVVTCHEFLQASGNHWQAAVSIADTNLLNSET
jgi:hypothetical protein